MTSFSWWNRAIKVAKHHLETQKETYQRFLSILMYQPPVGLVTVWVAMELMSTGRMFSLHPPANRRVSVANGNGDAAALDVPFDTTTNNNNGNNGNGNGAGDTKKRKRRRRNNKRGKRAWSLEDRDQSYRVYGAMGVEQIRGRLCTAALSHIVEKEEIMNPAFAQERTQASLFRRGRKKRQDKSDNTNVNGGGPNNQEEEEERRILKTPWIYGTALDALQLACPPGGSSRYEYVDKLRDALAKLRAADELLLVSNSPPQQQQQRHTNHWINDNTNVHHIRILQIASEVLELRATDALLRELRDGLLKTTYRLDRTVTYWERRVEQHAKAMAVAVWKPQRNLIQTTMDGDRLRLSYAQAAYQAELIRLGRICSMLLLEKPSSSSSSGKTDHPHLKFNKHRQSQDAHHHAGRPTEMQDTYLLRALQQQQQNGDDHDTTTMNSTLGDLSDASSNGNNSNYNNGDNHNQYPFHYYSPTDKQKWRSTWRLPKFSRYSIRIERGRPKLIHLGKETYIDGGRALDILMTEQAERDTGTVNSWLNDARVWIQQAQMTLCDVLEDTLEGSEVSMTATRTRIRNDLAMIRNAWDRSVPTTAQTDDTQQPVTGVVNSTKLAWGKMLELVDDVPSFRRVGEGRSVALRDLSIVGWLSEWDAFGIPSALLKIYLAYLLHTFISPHWPEICKIVKEAWESFVIFFMTHFWEPAKDVLKDVLNRETSSMLDDFNLQNEEHSLDIMLKDLLLGDGTETSRAKALEAATREYENDLRTGLFRNVASGHLLRLLLVQVQQLKVGMLNAVGDIDVLLSANQLNMRLMATIPAIIIITYATRFFARNLYNLRSRDIRPISRVHAEMTEHLHRMKSILLLAHDDGDTLDSSSLLNSSNFMLLGSAELGEFALKMHCYLVLLDYCSPQPFPKWQCDAIHRSMQDIFGSLQGRGRSHEPTGINVERSVALVDIAMRKHLELQKNL